MQFSCYFCKELFVPRKWGLKEALCDDCFYDAEEDEYMAIKEKIPKVPKVENLPKVEKRPLKVSFVRPGKTFLQALMS